MPSLIYSFTDPVAGQIGLFDDQSLQIAGAPAGTWRTNATANVNSLNYTGAGGAAVNVPITYSMTPDNRLNLAIGGGAAAALNGRILLEAQGGIRYSLVDVYGIDLCDLDANPNAGFFVHGAMTIDPKAGTLTLASNGTTVIVVTGSPQPGSTGSPIAVGQGTGADGATTATDLLSFSAATTNPGQAAPSPAELDLTGAWGLQAGQVVFNANFSSGPAQTGIAVTLLGNLKGLAYGFEFSEVGNETNVFFTIQGKITGDNHAGGWSLSLGYSNKVFQADVTINSAPVTPGGNGLTFNGSLHVQGVQIQLALAATYVFNGGKLQFQVTGSNSSNYSLALSGALTIDNAWNVQFAVSETAGGQPTYSISLGSAQNSPLGNAVSVFISGTGTSFKAGISVNLKFVNGALVPEASHPTP